MNENTILEENKEKKHIKNSFLGKIFGTFDVYKKEEILDKELKQFGKGNFMLLKRHFYFLFQPFCYMMLSFFIFLFLLFLTYIQYQTQIYLFISISLLYIIFTFQWIFITLSFMYYAISHSKMIYLEKDNLLEKNNEKFERFVNQSFISIIGQICIGIGNLILLIFFSQDLGGIFSVIGQFILNIGFIFLIYTIFKRLIDFEMDFTIIDPIKFVSYSQQGLHDFSSKDLETEIIKSVTIEQQGFIRSFFKFGKILIKGIGDETGVKKYSISLNFVKNPEKVKEKIDIIRNKRHEYLSKIKQEQLNDEF